MKRIAYSLLLFFLLSCSTVFAQWHFRYGLAGGFNIAPQHELYDPHFPLPAYSIISTTIINPGSFVCLEFGSFRLDNFSIRMQTFIEQEHDSGSIFNTIDAKYSETYHESVTYVEIPLTVMMPFVSGKVQAYVFAGPSIGLFLQGSGAAISTAFGQREFSIGKKWVGFGAYAGAGISYAFSSWLDCFIEVGYSHGLSNFSPVFVEHALREFRLYFGILFG